MKYTLAGLITLLLAGGVYAATFPDLAKNAAELKEELAANQVPDAGIPAATAPEKTINRTVEFPDTDMGYFKKSAEAVCYGAYYARSDYHNCSELKGDAKAICDGLYYAGAQYKNCADLSGNAKAVCDGVYYARADHKNCADLNGGARTICYGMYYAASDYQNCSELKDIN